MWTIAFFYLSFCWHCIKYNHSWKEVALVERKKGKSGY